MIPETLLQDVTVELLETKQTKSATHHFAQVG